MIYLDHNATTYMHLDVRKKMHELIDQQPLNPSSIHSYGRKSKSLLEASRKSIAELLGIANYFSDYQITFTSSGTEANNLILSNFQDGEILIASTEHLSIFAHSKISNNIRIVKVDKNGVLDLEDLIHKLQSLKAKKTLVSVMLANNETGVIQPIEQISEIAHNYGAFMHSDCVQAVGKIEVNIEKLKADFISLSAHKFGGPMGAGALISKTSFPLSAIIIGGGQEKSLRAGTENMPAIIGFGEAARIAAEELSLRFKHMHKLHIKLETELLSSNHDIEIAGINTNRLPNTSLIINANKTAEIQLIALDMKGVALSSGAACSSGKITSSHVLSAMHYPENKINSALRISLGCNTSVHDIETFLTIYNEINQ